MFRQETSYMYYLRTNQLLEQKKASLSRTGQGLPVHVGKVRQKVQPSPQFRRCKRVEPRPE
jgi:hypothetical protein